MKTDIEKAAKRLIEALYAKTQLSYVIVQPVHRYLCPVTRMGQGSGDCDCGGEELGTEANTAMRDLRKAIKDA